MPHCGGLKNLSGTVGATTLTVGQMPIHKHPLMSFTRVGYGSGINRPFDGNGDTLAFCGDEGGSQPHTHTLSGASGEASNLPPYYALSFIMRIA